MFKRFWKDERGNYAMMFAVLTVPLLVATGGAVDYSRAYDQRTLIQNSLDTAALAAGRKIGVMTTAQLKTEANNFYTSNANIKMSSPPTMTLTVTGATATASAQLQVPTTFLNIIGLSKITFDLSSTVTSGIGTLEVVMALDNSGSMDGTKISTLRTAAGDLATTLFNLASTSTKTDPIKVGLVPFAASVNVGSTYKTATWMDTTGVGTYNGSWTSSTVNNFSYFDRLKNTSWGGCVEERPMPYDTTDDAASTGTPGTMFVPMFAPDEPDTFTCSKSSCDYTGSGSDRAYSGAPDGGQSYNNYLPDKGGSCTGSTNTAYTSSDNEQDAFARTCKYGTTSSKATPVSITVGGIAGGPNFMCNTNALTPLSTTKTTVTSAITAMAAEGATNILSGLMWGWRLLSPTAPFTEGRAYTDTENNKILVLMTDGENTYYPNSTFVKSWYGAFGYVKDNHLGTTSTNSDTIVGKMNDRTALACVNIKRAGVTIYTVAFQVTDTDTLSMLTTCASDAAKAFQSSSTTALTAAFTAIGDSITQLRVTR